MPRPPAILPCATLLATLALAGCANTTSTPTSSGSTGGPAVQVSFKSAALHGQTLPAQYTCDGKNINPPLEWGPIPADTSELVLAAIGLTPATPNGKSGTATIEWAISGINPKLHKLNAGEVPQGAHIGQAPNKTRRYNLCPKKGTTTQYQFMLYGVQADAKVSPEFADQPILAALSKPGTSISATAEGAFLTRYKRQ